jgi:hypothetical protein
MDSATTADSKPAAPRGFLRRHLGKLLLIGIPLALVGILALYTAATLSFTYSRGERVGFVQKLSKKGWVCRTWEGELAMNPVPGSPPQIFAFTVPDEAVAHKITQSEGKRVSLSYEQKKGVPSKCFGDSEYFVRDVKPVGQ